MSGPINLVLKGCEIAELLWPLNDMFRQHWGQIGLADYDPIFEREADEALLRFSDRPGRAAWRNLSSGAWRVLFERHGQMVDMLSTWAQEPMVTVAAAASEGERRRDLMRLLLLRARIPWPPDQRSLGDPTKWH